MLLQIEHSLHFRYDGFIRESHLDVRVEPRTQAGQVLLEFSLLVGPTTRITRHEDWLGNAIHWFAITDYHDRIEVLARSLVDTRPEVVPPDRITEAVGDSSGALALWDFLQIDDPIVDGPALRSLYGDLKVDSAATVGDAVRVVGEGLTARFEYRSHVTDAHSTTEALLTGGGGVCQDFAHVALGLLRLRGIPARYVSGYLHVESDRDEPAQSHAWIEYWSNAHGWQPYDPTHGLVPGETYVTVAYGRSYRDVPPNRGIYQGLAAESLSAEVVTRQGQSPDRQRPADDLFMDLPVYAEAPDRPGRADLPSAATVAEQQQQQQQQQQ